MNEKNKFKLRNTHTLLIIILFILVGNFIYLYPKLDSSPVPTKWSPGIDWGRYYILNYGKVYERQENGLTWQSNIKNYGSVDVLPKIFFAIINEITGTVKFPDDLRFHYLFPWVGTIFLPIILLYWYVNISKNKYNVDFFIVMLYSMFPIASHINTMSGNTNGSPVARVFFLLIIILTIIVFNQITKEKRKLAILMFLLFPFFYFYHTWSYYLALCLTTIAILTSIKKSENNITNFAVYGIIIFFVSAIYYNTMLMTEPIRTIKNFPSEAPLQNPKFSGYESFRGMYSYLQTINSTLIIFILIIFIFFYFKNKYWKKHISHEQVLFYFVISEFLIAIGLFAWNGLLGIYSRIFETLTYISMLLSAYLLSRSEGKLKLVIRSILIIAVLLAVISYLTKPTYLDTSLTNEEFVGISFAGSKIPEKSYVFSDFRLGTPLIYFGQLGITTIDSPKHTFNMTEELLERIYYNISSPTRILNKIIHKNKYYLITSLHQTKVCLIDSSLKCFKPASSSFQEDLSNQKFDTIYSSKYFYIFSH